jgi:outer membrane lipopolysaccharide assembly protein LptE/RlpB
MQKKKIIIFTLILFLSNCGFTPVYLNNSKVNFSIEQVNFEGDRELNNFLKINLSRYKNTNDNKKIFIEANTKYEKIVLSKDTTGKATSYQLVAEVIFLIKPNNKKIVVTEKKIMDSMNDNFEENRFERSAKQGFASLMSTKLISELIIYK